MRGVLGDERERQNNGHVISCFARQHVAFIELPEIGIARALDALLHISRSAVIRGHREIPIAKLRVQVAQMLRGRARGLFRILPFVDPPGMPQTVFHPAIRDELPNSACASSRQRERLERALRLRQINQVLRNSFFMQDARNHFAITARTAQTRLHNGAPARSLEKIEEGQHFVVHRKRQVMRNVLGRFLGPLFQSRIDGERHLRHFIDGRWHRRRLLKTVPFAEGLQLVSVYGIDTRWNNSLSFGSLFGS